MDAISDYFISYNNDITVKQEKLPDSEVSLNHYFQFNKDTYPDCSLTIPQSAHNILDQTDLTIKEKSQANSNFSFKGKKPFKIIRMKREESSDSIEVKIEPEKKVMDNYRRELRREAAKKKFQNKTNSKSVASSDDQSSNYEALLSSDMDEKTQKKMLQMIRNRISAQNSRDRRKAYVGTLEDVKDLLSQENRQLLDDKNKLLLEVQKLEFANEILLKERHFLLNNQDIPCMNCESSSKENDKMYSEDTLTLPAKNTPLMPNNAVNLGISLGLTIGSMLANRQNNKNSSTLKVPNVNQLHPFDLRSLNVQDVQNGRSVSLSLDQEERRINMLRKCSKSTMASPTTSPMIEEPFMSNYYEGSKQKKSSFWDQAIDGDDNMTLEPKAFDNETTNVIQEEKEDILDLHNFQGASNRGNLSLNFPTASVMEKILNGHSLKQKMIELEKGGFLKLFHNQFPLSN